MNRSKAIRRLALVAVFGLARLAQAQESSPPEHQHHEMPPASPSSSSATQDAGTSEAEHVAPQPPQHAMEPMPYHDMAAMMQMDDRERFGKVLLDQLEWRDTNAGDAAVWEGQAWYGGDSNKVFVKSEGKRVRSMTEEARAELLWDRIFSRWWSTQAGVREDFGAGPARTWAALGIEGLAPYWFDVEATVYLGEQGRTAARLKTEYDLLFTQRLILQPELETNLYGKSDRERQIGAGLSDIDLGLRLRYEVRREFAPYLGVAWNRKFSGTADYARAAGLKVSEVQFVVGLRIWF
jgi:copper resistance protein B